MPRIYHPNVKDSEHEHPDDEASLAVMFDTGWKLAPVAKSDNPALAPEPVTYTPVKPAEATDETEGYDGLTKEQLQDQLRSRDLPVSGTVAELVARLEDDDASKSTE